MPGSTEVNVAQFKSLGKEVRDLKEIKEIGLDLVNLHITSTSVVVLSVSSFVNVVEMKSETGFVIVLAG